MATLLDYQGEHCVADAVLCGFFHTQKRQLSKNYYLDSWCSGEKVSLSGLTLTSPGAFLQTSLYVYDCKYLKFKAKTDIPVILSIRESLQKRVDPKQISVYIHDCHPLKAD